MPWYNSKSLFVAALTALLLLFFTGGYYARPQNLGASGVTASQLTSMRQQSALAIDSNGNGTITWAFPFASAPIIELNPVNSAGTTPYLCNVTTNSTTSTSFHCWQIQSQANGILGITISLGASNAPLSTSIMVTGSLATQ